MLWLFKRALMVTLPLCVGLAILIPQAGARSSSDYTSHWLKFGFETCALPCYAGMSPGLTRIADAPTLIEHNVGGLVGLVLPSGSYIDYSALNEDRSLSGFVQSQFGTISHIQLSTTIEFSVLIEQLGVPDCISVDWYNPRIRWFVWEQAGSSIVATLSHTNPVRSLGGLMQTDHISIRGSTHLCNSPQTMNWRGFAPAWRYIQLTRMGSFSN
jgi:hypothetical protein